MNLIIYQFIKINFIDYRFKIIKKLMEFKIVSFTGAVVH